jgi:hypothetical protein
MAKPTRAELEALRSALNMLQGLQSQTGSGGGAVETVQSAQDITVDLGPLVNGQGPQIAEYYGNHARAISGALQRSGEGVAAAVAMLQATIANYEAHEQKLSGAANDTANGGGAGSASPVSSGRGLGT